jgi:hypothetical protein
MVSCVPRSPDLVRSASSAMVRPRAGCAAGDDYQSDFHRAGPESACVTLRCRNLLSLNSKAALRVSFSSARCGPGSPCMNVPKLSEKLGD